MTATEFTRPGYHIKAAFPGAEPAERPVMVYLAQMLELWGLRPIGPLRGSMVIEYADAMQRIHEWWILCDNGGEINVERINDHSTLRSVPYAQSRGLVPIGRLAWFCAMVIKGDEIPSYGPNESVDDIVLED